MPRVSAPGPGPVARGDRLLAPDLARGLALLGIALANGVTYLTGLDVGPLLRPVQAGAADRVVDALVGLLVDNRAFPLFTMLVAYGYVTVLRRQAGAGVPWPRAGRLLVRRSLALCALGAAHLVLLFAGDILLSYGLLGLVLVLVCGPGTPRSACSAGPRCPRSCCSGPWTGSGPTPPPPPRGPTTCSSGWARAPRRCSPPRSWSRPCCPPPWWACCWPATACSRTRCRTCRGCAGPRAGGLVLGVLGAVPLVLVATRVVEAPLAARVVAGALHGGTGLLGAVGFLAGVAWACAAREQRRGPGAPRRGAVRALAATGERSLTCYLLQSVLLVPLLSAWGLGLADGTSTALVAGVSVLVWLVTVAVAVALDLAGRRGPAELLLRRLVYGRAGRPAGAAP